MTALSRTPQNTNLAQVTKHLLVFQRIPTVQYFCQSVNIPGVSVSGISRSTPFTDLWYPSTKMEYNQFDITFLVDEGLTTWKTLQDWFRAVASPKSFDEKNTLLQLQGGSKFSDATVTLLSALNNSIAQVYFHNLFPLSLGDLTFDTTQSADNILTSTATFRYDYYDLLPVTS